MYEEFAMDSADVVGGYDATEMLRQASQQFTPYGHQPYGRCIGKSKLL